MKHLIPTIAAVLTSLSAPSYADPASWTAGPFDMPESAIFDPTHDRIIVSVIQGHRGAEDGNGHLALLTPAGEISNPSWTTGLDAPKGMAIVGDRLLVADLTRVHEIDLATGLLLRSLDVEGAVFLNDITSDGHQAFVSDLMENRIWHYQAGDMTVWLEDDALAHPNGLLWDGSQLVVGSWGQGMRDDFSTEVAGGLLAVDIATKAITTIVPRLGNLDGIVRIGETLLVSDWITGQLFEVAADGTHRVMAEYPAGLADIGVYGNALLLPSMLDGHVSLQTISND